MFGALYYKLDCEGDCSEAVRIPTYLTILFNSDMGLSYWPILALGTQEKMKTNVFQKQKIALLICVSKNS